MSRLLIHRDAYDDLQSIKARGELDDYGVLLAFLQQAKSDHRLLNSMSEDWFGEDGSADYTVRKIVSMHRRGRRLWRVKVLTLKGLASSYRVLYAIDPRATDCYVLAVPHREFAYDESHPRIQQLVALYDSLDLP